MPDALRVEREPGLARVTLDRPPLNLLEPSLIEALRATFRRAGVDVLELSTAGSLVDPLVRFVTQRRRRGVVARR
jgi:enoyl-CoA hydratase/carnithine racemase